MIFAVITGMSCNLNGLHAAVLFRSVLCSDFVGEGQTQGSRQSVNRYDLKVLQIS